MPKEECKVASGCKHKERKPKKPHYIPRPFGKPYNYKCFQCPFTCMEKSHLYNHMKYSLCKNSLSLLIESDWPYKKGNLLHADPFRLQQGIPGTRTSPLTKEQQQDNGTMGEETITMTVATPAPAAQTRNSELVFTDDADEAEMEDRDTEGIVAQAEVVEMAEDNSDSADPNCSRSGTKRGKQEADLVMADMFSLEEQLLRARSVEVEAKLRHYRLSKTCLSGPAALLSEQWRLLSSQTPGTKTKSDSVSGSLPCYPPPLPQGHLECPDASSINLSLFGVGYPLTPGLFSYLNPTLGAVSNGSTAPAQINPFPFLASAAAAQLAHPHTASDRAMLPPRFYYPFLCEHALGSTLSTQNTTEAAKATKVSSTSLDSTYASKLNMWKVPALRSNTSHASSGSWGSSSISSPEAGQQCGERHVNRDGRVGWGQEQGVKRMAVASLDPHSTPAEKKPTLFQVDRVTPANAATAADRLVDNSFHAQAGLDERYPDPKSSAPLSPTSASPSPMHCSEQGREQVEERERGMQREGESAASLLRDLSSALYEYRQAEQRAALLPEQRHLWAHLGKIRSELSHIQQTLERTARNAEGPLDLSVKREPVVTMTEGTGQVVTMVERKEAKVETCSETEEEEEEEEEMEEGGQEEGVTEKLKEKRKRSLDILIKLNQSAISLVKPGVSMVKAEGLPCDGLALRAGEAEALWHSRTTKCEADSSVLLCAKTPNRPPSIHHLDAMCPPSPLTATDA